MTNLKVLPTTQKKSFELDSKDKDIRVLYLTESIDAPFRYRCENYQQLLQKYGYIADTEVINDFSYINVKNYNLIVLFRLCWNTNVEKVVVTAKKYNIPTVFDIDDYIFNPQEITNLSFYNTISFDDQLRYQVKSKSLAKTFLESDYFFGSTEELVDIAKRSGKESFLLPNLLSDELLHYSKMANLLSSLKNNTPVISYLSGSNTHDNDFEVVANVLLKVLEERDVFLLLVGHLNLRDEFKKYEHKIARIPFVNWRLLPYIQSLSWVNLAPLAEINTFSNSKSALKFFEAAAVKVPTIASPSREMKKYISNGINGFIAKDIHEWDKYLEFCLDKKNSQCIGKQARQYCLKNLSFLSHQVNTVSIFSRIISEKRSKFNIPEINTFHYNHNSISKLRLREKFNIYKILLKLALKFNLKRNLKAICHKSYQYKKENSLNIHRILPEVIVDQEISVRSKLRNPVNISLLDGSSCTINLQPSLKDSNYFIANNNDPHICNIDLPAEAAEKKYLFLKQICKTSDKDQISFAQLFWQSDTNSSYSEEYSVTFPIYPDGKVHNYLVNLEEYTNKIPTKWRNSTNIQRLRFDPMCNSGIFQILEFQFL